MYQKIKYTPKTDHRTREEVLASIAKLESEIAELDRKHELLCTDAGRSAYIDGLNNGIAIARRVDAEELNAPDDGLTEELRTLRRDAFFEGFDMLFKNPIPRAELPALTTLETAWRRAWL
jgi:hypothetical protein